MPTVLITGCSSGFGELAALQFARAGWRTFATMRTPAKGQALVDTAAAEGLDLHVVALDVNDEDSVAAAVAEAGTIDCLVNNAGIELLGPVHLVTDEEARWQFETNVFGLLRMVRHVAPGMAERGSGTIVNVGSAAGYVGVPYSGVYAATKHAVSALSEALHFELGASGVRVVVIEPGQFGTALGANARHMAGLTGKEEVRFDRYRQAQRRLSSGGEPPSPSIVAELILAAAADPTMPVHVPIGQDAEMIVGLRRTMSFEDFEQTMRVALDWHE